MVYTFQLRRFSSEKVCSIFVENGPFRNFFLVAPTQMQHRQGSSGASYDENEFMSQYVWQYRVKIENKFEVLFFRF